MSVEEIDKLIGEGKLVEQDLIEFYGNEWWRVDGGVEV